MNPYFSISLLAEAVSNCGSQAEKSLPKPLTDDFTTKEETQNNL